MPTPRVTSLRWALEDDARGWGKNVIVGSGVSDDGKTGGGIVELGLVTTRVRRPMSRRDDNGGSCSDDVETRVMARVVMSGSGRLRT